MHLTSPPPACLLVPISELSDTIYLIGVAGVLLQMVALSASSTNSLNACSVNIKILNDTVYP